MTVYLSTGEPTIADPLPNVFKASGNADLQGPLRESGMAHVGSLNRARLPEGNAVDPIDPVAWRALADLATERKFPLTVEAEGPLNYDYSLWRDDESECRRRIGLVATGLSVWAAYRPKVPRYVEHGTPGLLTVPSTGPRPGYKEFLDFEAAALSPLVAGPTVLAYLAPWNTVDDWDVSVRFYLDQAATRYKGTPRLILSPKLWAGGEEKGYVGDAVMDHMTAYAMVNGCDAEWWGLYNPSQQPIPQAWAYLRKMFGRPGGRDTVPGGGR
jgi:hypothetical protein